MTNYTVDWTEPATEALAAIWTPARDRQRVTQAVNIIDRLLGQDPLRNGVHVSEGIYAIEVHPLRAQFEVSPKDRTVRVVSLGELP